MNSKPIIFSAPMVRALLDGRKTQTRRVMKAQPQPYAGGVHPNHVAKHPAPYIDAYCSKRKTSANPRGMSADWCWWSEDDRCGPFVGKCPYIPGDLLWVREAWGINLVGYIRPATIPKSCPQDVLAGDMVYFATEEDAEIQNEMPRCPSLFMPRWASRLTLRVTNIRAERLQDISEEDARSEGVKRADIGRRSLWSGHDTERPTLPSARQAFLDHIWTDLYGEHDTKSVGANPWVWVYEFEVIRRNVDEVMA